MVYYFTLSVGSEAALFKNKNNSSNNNKKLIFPQAKVWILTIRWDKPVLKIVLH